MPVLRIRKTSQNIAVSRFNTDIIVRADSDNDTLNFEDKFILGPRGEPDGTITDLKNGDGALMKGQANLLAGTTAGLLGADNPGNTPRGNNPQTTHPRRIFMYFDFVKIR